MSTYSTLSFISQGDAAVTFELFRTSIRGISEIRMTLYGESFPFLDISFEYRESEFSSWKSNPILSAGPKIGIEGNILNGLACSPSGTVHSVYWSHRLNGIPDGCECEIMLKILPNPIIFLPSNFGTYIERLPSHELEGTIGHFSVNMNRSGDFICLSEDSMEIMSRTGEIVLSVSGISDPAYALQKTDGNYLILDSGNNRIIETDFEGNLERELDLSLYVNNPLFFAYDEFIQTILISGGLIPSVYEFTWGDDYGTLLWQHGGIAPGNGQNELDHPHGVSYGDDKSIIYIADFGNNRTVKIDRKTGEISISESTNISGVDVFYNYPKFVQATKDGSLLILEAQGEQERYSRNPETHPAIRRYLASRSRNVRETTKDDLPEYNGLLFSPVLHTIFRDFTIDSSSASSLNSSSSSSSSFSSKSSSSNSSISSVSSSSSSSMSSSSSSSLSTSASSTSSKSSTSTESTASTESSESSESSQLPANVYISGEGFGVLNIEWIEISNSGEQSQDMTGWRIVSHEQPPPCPLGSPVQEYTFPNGFILNAGANVRIVSGPLATNNPPTQLLWQNAYIWNNTGDIGDLYNSSDILIDTISTGNCV